MTAHIPSSNQQCPNRPENINKEFQQFPCLIREPANVLQNNVHLFTLIREQGHLCVDKLFTHGLGVKILNSEQRSTVFVKLLLLPLPEIK